LLSSPPTAASSLPLWKSPCFALGEKSTNDFQHSFEVLCGGPTTFFIWRLSLPRVPLLCSPVLAVSVSLLVVGKDFL